MFSGRTVFAYIHGHSVGGTNPSLLEAMIMKNIIIAHDNVFNREVASDSVLYFKDSSNLKNHIENIEKKSEVYQDLREKSCQRVKKKYTWDKIIDKYVTFFMADKTNYK